MQYIVEHCQSQGEMNKIPKLDTMKKLPKQSENFYIRVLLLVNKDKYFQDKFHINF